jgi:hypothetical protein
LNLPGGTYTIVCSAPGYQSVTVNNVTILDGHTRALNFYMYGATDGGQPEMLTGIQQYSMDELTIYPNPATDEVNIATGSALRSVKIMNNMGQLVYNSPADGFTLKVNASNLIQGIYFIEVETENSKFIEKLVIR